MSEENKQYYGFDAFEWLNGVHGFPPPERTVESVPPMIPTFPLQNGQPCPKLQPDGSWKVYAYQGPPEEIKAKNVVSKTDFMDLFGFPKLTEIQAVAQTDIEVKTAWEYGLAFNEIVVDHPKTLALLALLGTKQIGEKPILTVEEIDKISHNQQIW